MYPKSQARTIRSLGSIALVNIASDETHRALVYLAATARLGRPIPVETFDAYAEAPDPRPAQYKMTGGITASARMYEQMITSSIQGTRTLIARAEKMSTYLSRVGWATIENETIAPTALGNAVLQALNTPVVDVSVEDPITVVIDPEDPLAYAKVFGLIASRDAGLIVDPYLALPEFYQVADLPAVTRVLTSDHDMKSKRPVIAQALAAIERDLEVGYVPLKRLHDRFFIPDEGDVLVFGSSLNSIARRPGVVTPLADDTASGAIRSAYEQLWRDATLIKPADPKPSPPT